MGKSDHIGKYVISLSHQIRRTIDHQVAQYGLTSVQSRIICYIYKESKKRDVFQKDIEEEFGIRRSSVTNVIQLLEKNCFLCRESVLEDGRLKKLMLTEKGIEVQCSVMQSIERVEQMLTDTLGEEEKKHFIEMIYRLSQEMDRYSNLFRL